MTDRLNELNDKIIENLEKQVAYYEDIIKIDNDKIADLERRLDVAEKENTELKKQLELANGRLQGYLAENGLSSIA